MAAPRFNRHTIPYPPDLQVTPLTQTAVRMIVCSSTIGRYESDTPKRSKALQTQINAVSAQVLNDQAGGIGELPLA